MALFWIIVGEVPGRQNETNLTSLPWVEGILVEVFQLLFGAGQASLTIRKIKLDNFLALPGTGIDDTAAYANLFLVAENRLIDVEI